jgi:hypothetical protein
VSIWIDDWVEEVGWYLIPLNFSKWRFTMKTAKKNEDRDFEISILDAPEAFKMFIGKKYKIQAIGKDARWDKKVIQFGCFFSKLFPSVMRNKLGINRNIKIALSTEEKVEDIEYKEELGKLNPWLIRDYAAELAESTTNKN